MKKLLCLFIVFSLFACSDFKNPFSKKKDRPPLDSFYVGKVPQIGELERFQMVAGGSQLPPFVIDTKEGHVWVFRSPDVHFQLINFDKKYQSALEAVQAYSSQKEPDKKKNQQAPQAALDFLKKNPNLIDQFVAKYGYKPEGF